MGPVVIGIGTRVGRDDGIGLYLVELLAEEGALAEGEAILLEGADAATVASTLLELDRPVVIADCADMGIAPGAFRVFQAEEASVAVRSDATSTHGLGLADGLSIARSLGFERRVVIFAVQPFDVSVGFFLSKDMENLLPDYLNALRATVMSCVSC